MYTGFVGIFRSLVNLKWVFDVCRSNLFESETEKIHELSFDLPAVNVSLDKSVGHFQENHKKQKHQVTFLNDRRSLNIICLTIIIDANFWYCFQPPPHISLVLGQSPTICINLARLTLCLRRLNFTFGSHFCHTAISNSKFFSSQQNSLFFHGKKKFVYSRSISFDFYNWTLIERSTMWPTVNIWTRKKNSAEK